jgi:PAS domain S-box-containing protein
VLLDVVLGDMDGLQVCQHIQADTQLADTFVVLLSGQKIAADNHAEGLEVGADAYIVRPISNRALLARVGAMLRIQNVEKMLRAQMRELRERVKELNCLYGISQLVEHADLSLPEILRGTVELVSQAWQYPEIVCARITLEDQEYQTEGFRETIWRQSRDIRVYREPAGRIEVYYLEERPEEDEGPFLQEERSLLNAVAERLGRIVERVRIEQALSRYELIVSTVSDPISYLDRDYVYRAVNETYARLAKRPREEIVGLSVADLLGAEVFEEEVKPHLDRCLAGEEVHYQAWFPVPQEQPRYMDVGYYPAYAQDGSVAGVVVASRDMTERKQVEEALQRERDLVARVMNTSPVGIAVFDRQGRITFANTLLQQLANQVGVTTLIGRSYNEPVWQGSTPEDEPLADDALPFAQVMARGREVHNIEFNIKLPDGPRLFLSSNATPLFDGSGEVESVIVTTQDITPRKRAEAQLEEAAATAERERLARELHDAVTQSLFSVAAIAEALPRVWEREPEEARRGLEELRQLTQGALAEMRAMLLELRPAALTEHELGVLLRQLTDALMSRTRLAVTTTIVGKCPLPADVQIALYRIAQEALNNITKHARASQAKLSLHCAPGQVRLRISDDGHGFDLDTAQAHHLGLRIMRERAQAIGATLTIESRPDHGTRIEVNWHRA